VSRNASVLECESLGVPMSRCASVSECDCLVVRVSRSARVSECKCLVQGSWSARVSKCECLGMQVFCSATVSKCIRFSLLHRNLKLRVICRSSIILGCVFIFCIPLHDHQASLSAARAGLGTKFVFATFSCSFNYRQVLRPICLLFGLYGTQSSSGSPPARFRDDRILSRPGRSGGDQPGFETIGGWET